MDQQSRQRMPYGSRPRLTDVRFGGSTIPAHENGGWALPGGKVTRDPLEALAAATQFAKVIDREPRRTKPKPAKPVIRRRKAAELITFCGVV